MQARARWGDDFGREQSASQPPLPGGSDSERATGSHGPSRSGVAPTCIAAPRAGRVPLRAPHPTCVFGGPHARPPLPRIRHAEPACRPTSRPRHRGAGRAHLSECFVRLSRRRPRRGALQPGALRPRLLPALQPDQRDARGTGRGPRRRARGARGRERPGRAPSCGRDHRGGGGPHRRLPLPLRRQPQPPRVHPAPLRDRDHVRGPARRRCVPGRHSPDDEAPLRGDGGQPGLRGPRRSGRRRGGPRSRVCRSSSTTRSRLRGSAVPSSSARTSSTTARPSS